MKFFISVDMEGVSGMASTFGMQKDDKYYRELLTKEVNAVISGILGVCKKPKEILVCDSHNEGENILPDKLNPAALLTRGYPRPFYMMTGIDSSFDLVYFVGYHASTGTQGAVLDHTFSGQRIQKVIINGRAVGEFDLSAGLAGEYGVPVGFASGDDKFAMQVKKVAPRVKTVVTKYGIARNSAKMLHPEKTLELIEKRAFEATRDIKKMKPLKFKKPIHVDVEFSRTTHADVVCQIPVLKRVDGRRVAFRNKNFKDLYNLFSAIVTLAHTVK